MIPTSSTSSTSYSSSQLLSLYQASSPMEQAIIRALSLNFDSLRQQDLLSILQRVLPGRLFNTPADRKEISSLLMSLESKGLTCKEKGSAHHQPLIRNAVLLDVLEHKVFDDYNRCLQSLNQYESRGWGRTFSSFNQALRKFQEQLFGEASLDEINQTRVRIYDEFGHVLKEDPLHSLLGSPVSVALLEHCTYGQNIGMLLLGMAMDRLQLEPELGAFLVDRMQSHSVTASPALLVLYLIYTGQMELAEKCLNQPWPSGNEADQKCILGCLHFLQGRYEQALLCLNESVIQLKKQTRKRKIALGHYPGVFHLFSLLAVDQPQNIQQGLELTDTAGKQTVLSNLFLLNIRGVFTQMAGQTPEHISVDSSLLRNLPLYRFFYMLSIWWITREKGMEILPELCRTMQKMALKNGYPWLAAECASLLAGMGQDPERNQRKADELHLQCRTVSCIAIVQPKEKNMQRLHALLAMIATSHQQARPPVASITQRLRWFFTYQQALGICELSPVLQKLGKNGKWSKGRSVALKTLYESYRDMEGLTDQDRLICQTLAYKPDYFSHYRREVLVFELEKMALAAIGHPQIYLSENEDVLVELSRGELELRISKKKDILKLTLWPTRPKETSSVFLVRESPTHYKVYQVNAEQEKLFALFKEPLVLPASTTEQVREVASSLSTMVTVHSDVGGGQEVEEVAADPRPHLHLLPFQDGLRVEILTRPITNGSWHPPGRGGAIVFGEQEGKRVQAKRDMAREREARDQLLAACPVLGYSQEIEGQFLFPGPAESLELLSQLQQFPDCTVHWPRGQSFSLRAEAGFNNLSLRIKKDRDWFAASGSLQVDEQTVLDLQELLGLLDLAQGRFVPLQDGSYLALTSALRKRLEELRIYSEKGKEGLRFNPLAALALDDLTSEVSVEGDRQWMAHKKRLSEIITPSLPSTLTASLRDYQVQGFSWLAQLSHWQMGACLADDMGLGKTLQALAVILLRAPLGPTLVVAPLSVAGNWAEEASRFAPTLNVKSYGQGDRQEMLDGLGSFDLLICSYGLLQVQGEMLAKVAWQVVVLDEAQAIKNRQTKRAKSAMALQAQFRLITTGTPLENHLGELWALFNFINPGLLGSHQRFTENFAIPIERDKDRERLRQLQRLIQPFILRRMKNDVLQELPAKTEITLKVEMSAEESALYEAQRQSALARLAEDKDAQDGQHLRILVEIMRLRRLCCNPALILPDAAIASSKLKVFSDILAEMLENRHKALVFSQFIDHLAILRALLDEKKISYQYLDGSTSVSQRRERIAAFQAGVGEVFLISLKAGGAGLNLTAADYVIHMDPWWNPAVEDQASDRAHRIGQERPVTVYRLVMKDSIEEQIVGLHKDKRELANSLLDGADAAGRLSAGELLDLLRGGEKG
ncbi:MAG: DEAD/DEAH box helicase [Chlorobium sp.]|nr:DEAD/DEAH box helicase [Chlorobium sp.]